MSLEQLASAEPLIALVVAMGENRAIGRGGDLPWHLPATCAISVRSPWASPSSWGGAPSSPCRGCSMDASISCSPATAVSSRPTRSWRTAWRRGSPPRGPRLKRTGAAEIMIIGGEDVFREVLPQTDRIYLTEVHASPDADTWFPALDMSEWREVSRESACARPQGRPRLQLRRARPESLASRPALHAPGEWPITLATLVAGPPF